MKASCKRLSVMLSIRQVSMRSVQGPHWWKVVLKRNSISLTAFEKNVELLFSIFYRGKKKLFLFNTRKKKKWKESTFCYWAVPINCSSRSVGCGNWLKENVKIKLFLTRHRFLRLAQIFKHRCRCSIVFSLYMKYSDGEVQILQFW